MLFQITIITKGLRTLIARIGLKWFCKLLTTEKAFGHCLQWYGFWPEYTLKCFFRSPLLEKNLGHWLQGYRFSPQFFLKWFFKLAFWEKAFWHRLHENFFSPVWVLEWVFLLLTLLNCFSQWLQKYILLLNTHMK